MRERDCVLIGAAVLLAGVLGIAGCGGGNNEGEGGGESASPAAEVSAEDAHGAWWCAEHGVPEEECSLCSAAAAARFKEKGDWCDKHNRAESQCFVCDPSRADRYVKLYEAKFGKKPPKRTE